MRSGVPRLATPRACLVTPSATSAGVGRDVLLLLADARQHVFTRWSPTPAFEALAGRWRADTAGVDGRPAWRSGAPAERRGGPPVAGCRQCGRGKVGRPAAPKRLTVESRARRPVTRSAGAQPGGAAAGRRVIGDPVVEPGEEARGRAARFEVLGPVGLRPDQVGLVVVRGAGLRDRGAVVSSGRGSAGVVTSSTSPPRTPRNRWSARAPVGRFGPISRGRRSQRSEVCRGGRWGGSRRAGLGERRQSPRVRAELATTTVTPDAGADRPPLRRGGPARRHPAPAPRH